MILAVVGVVLVLAIGVLVWWFRREQHRRLPAVSTPPIVFVPHSEHTDHWLAPQAEGEMRPAGMAAQSTQVDSDEEVPVRRVAGLADSVVIRRPGRRVVDDGLGSADSGRGAYGAAAPVGAAFAPVAPGPAASTAASSAVSPDLTAAPALAPSDGQRGYAAPAFVRPAAEPVIAGSTLRMLPGRLEYVDGDGAAADIRFVHCSAGPEQRVTLGRAEGPSYEHVQLRSPTVSRMHAALTYRDGRWSIANLSDTNPLRLNGLELASDSGTVVLSDGDLIELGDLVLRFRG